MSSRKIKVGCLARASVNTCFILAAACPTQPTLQSAVERLMKLSPPSAARVLAVSVFPQPGGPWSQQTLGQKHAGSPVGLEITEDLNVSLQLSRAALWDDQGVPAGALGLPLRGPGPPLRGHRDASGGFLGPSVGGVLVGLA